MYVGLRATGAFYSGQFGRNRNTHKKKKKERLDGLYWYVVIEFCDNCWFFTAVLSGPGQRFTRRYVRIY